MTPRAEAALARYREATAEQERIRQEAEQQMARTRRERAAALIEMNTAGMSYRDMAKAIGISAPRIQQLINEYRETP